MTSTFVFETQETFTEMLEQRDHTHLELICKIKESIITLDKGAAEYNETIGKVDFV